MRAADTPDTNDQQIAHNCNAEGDNVMTANTTVLKGGRVIDPARGIDDVRDLVLRDGLVADTLDGNGDGVEIFDATDSIVVPGLVDIHSHFFYGVTSMAVDPRQAFHPKGTVIAVDAGTSGSANFFNLRTFMMEPSDLHLYAFLNIYALGMAAGPGDSFRHIKNARPLDMADVESAAKMISRNPEWLVGVKLLAPGPDRPWFEHTAELVARTRKVAEMTSTRVMLHIDGGAPLDTTIGSLEAGDIVTHAFHGNEPNILDQAGKVRPEALEARDRGVVFDFAPADHHHFSWNVLEAAAEQGFWPDTISTDIANPVKGEADFASMPDCMSMLLHLDMPLPEVVAAATTRPAKSIGREDRHASLAPGRSADVTVLKLVDSPRVFRSMGQGEERTVSRRLIPVATICRGKWLWRNDMGARS